MMRRKKHKTIFLSLLLYAANSFSCEEFRSDAFPPLKVSDGIIAFNEEPLLDNGKDIGDIRIEVSFVSCKGNKQRIAGLPFLTATGTVRAAFLEKVAANEKPALFIIHSVGVATYTGYNYMSDYYTIHVYDNTLAGYVRNNKISNYFGVGGDISSNPEQISLDYHFPYQTAEAVNSKLNSIAFKRWFRGENIKLKINKKTSIHATASLHDVTKMYLIKGDQAQQTSVEAGWVEFLFSTSKHKDIRGWIKCVDAEGC